MDREVRWFQRNPGKSLVLAVAGILLAVECIGQASYFFSHGNTFLLQMQPKVREVFSPYGLYEHAPNSTVYLNKFPTPYRNTPTNLTTDQYGFVHNGYRRPIRHDEYLIFLVGGSSLEGRGASGNNATISACLERILREQGKKARVVNAALSGYMSYQEAARVEGKIIPEFQPDMIIAFDGRNDGFYAVVSPQWRPNWQPYFDEISGALNSRIRPVQLHAWLIEHSTIALLFHKINNRLHKRNGIAPPPKREGDVVMKRAASMYLANHMGIKGACDFLHIKYFVFLQPTLVPALKKYISQGEDGFIRGAAGQYADSDIGYTKGMEGFYREVLQQLRPEDSSWFFDVSQFFYGTKEDVYSDSCHYTDRGNELIAEKIASVLLSQID